MKIYDGRGREVCENALMADTFLKRLKGLLGRKYLNDKESMVIHPCSGIHTFFMKFNIDLVFLDGEKNIIKKIEDIAPNKVVKNVKNARYVIEMDSKNSNIGEYVIGDTLKIE